MIKHIFTLVWNKKKSNFLLFLEIFFSFMILFAVFSFVVTNLRAYQTPLGFDSENVWLANMMIEDDSDSAEVAQMKTLLRQEMVALPEIEDVSFSFDITPFSNSAWQTGGNDNGFEIFTCILKNDQFYEKTGGLNVIEGRWFNEDDKNAKYVPIVISKRFRDESFKGRGVLDSLLTLEKDDNGNNVYNKIIGVVDHYKYQGEFSEEANATFIYTPFTSKESATMHIRIKEGASTGNLEEKINRLIANVTKRNDFTIQYLETRRKRNSQDTWIPMIALLSISGFLIINVALGLFGVLWYNINKRRSEIGLRRTLGASRAEISFQFIGEVVAVTLMGILVGLFFAIQFPLMKFFEVDNINYYYAMLWTSAVILILVLICAFQPSRQAARINPAIALHED